MKVRSSVLTPMLAEPLTKVDSADGALDRFATNASWAFEQKINGRRGMVIVNADGVRCLNRKGEIATRELSRSLSRAFAAIKGDFIFDGEILDDQFWIFDLPVAGMLLDPVAPYQERREMLERLFTVWDVPGVIRLVPWATDAEEKRALAERLLKAKCEGVMVKKLDAPYVSGEGGKRRSLSWLKAKFWNDVDCYVTRIGTDGKANMTLSMWNGQRFVEVGECTALAGDGARVRVGAVVTVKVLYSTNDDRLYGPPTIPRLRDDKAPEECTIDQLDAIRVNKEVLA